MGYFGSPMGILLHKGLTPGLLGFPLLFNLFGGVAGREGKPQHKGTWLMGGETQDPWGVCPHVPPAHAVG